MWWCKFPILWHRKKVPQITHHLNNIDISNMLSVSCRFVGPLLGAQGRPMPPMPSQMHKTRHVCLKFTSPAWEKLQPSSKFPLKIVETSTHFARCVCKRLNKPSRKLIMFVPHIHTYIHTYIYTHIIFSIDIMFIMINYSNHYYYSY